MCIFLLKGKAMVSVSFIYRKKTLNFQNSKKKKEISPLTINRIRKRKKDEKNIYIQKKIMKIILQLYRPFRVCVNITSGFAPEEEPVLYVTERILDVHLYYFIIIVKKLCIFQSSVAKFLLLFNYLMNKSKVFDDC